MKSFNMTRKDIINSQSATPLQKFKGEAVTGIGFAIDERPDENGELREVGVIITKEHGALTCISSTAIKSIDSIIDYATEENLSEVPFEVRFGKSNAGREFITLYLL